MTEIARGRLFQEESFECDFLRGVKIKTFEADAEGNDVNVVILTLPNSPFYYKFFLDVGLGMVEEWDLEEKEGDYEDLEDIFHKYNVTPEDQLKRVFCVATNDDYSVITFEFSNVSFRFKYSDEDDQDTYTILEVIN